MLALIISSAHSTLSPDSQVAFFAPSLHQDFCSNEAQEDIPWSL